MLVLQAGESLISNSFSLHYVEDMECEQCRYKMTQQTNNTFFHLAFTSQLTEVQNTSSHRVAAPKPLSAVAAPCAPMQSARWRGVLMAAIALAARSTEAASARTAWLQEEELLLTSERSEHILTCVAVC